MKTINEETREPNFKIHESCDEVIKIVEDKENKNYMLAIGSKIIYPKTIESIEEANKIVKEKPIELLINITYLIIKTEQKLNKQLKNENENENENKQH